VYANHYYEDDDDGPGAFCAGTVVFIFIVTGLYFLISSTDTTRADKLTEFEGHVSNWTDLHRKEFADTAFWVTSLVEFNGVAQETFSQLAPIQLVQTRMDEPVKDDSEDVPTFDPLSHSLPLDAAPTFVKEINFSSFNLSEAMPTITLHVHTNEEKDVKDLMRPSVATLPTYKIPLFQWE
jgi:hypothetical protein